MYFVIAFTVFVAAMVLGVIFEASMVFPLLLGYFAFSAVAVKNGTSVKRILELTGEGMKNSWVVVKIMICIGIITAMWRAGGTIMFFVYHGINAITPPLFIMAAFVLPLILSYVLGTSFGVASTMGMIIMTIAVAGGANVVITAGAVMSGIYFGDRGSPASSSAALTAMVTGTEIYTNIKYMHKTALIPLTVTAALYAWLSYRNPLTGIDTAILIEIAERYDVSWFIMIPALLMLVLPLFKVKIYIAMLISAFTAFVMAVFMQGVAVLDALKACALGVPTDGTYLGDLAAGGGLISMLEICIILLISCSYSPIFRETGMLDPITAGIGILIKRVGRFPTVTLVSMAACAIFCNQTIAVIMVGVVMKEAYEKVGGSSQEFCIDIENSCIVLAGMIPWCIACSVPLKMLGADISSLKYSFLLYFIPLIYLFTKRWFFSSAAGQNNGGEPK